MIRVSLSTTLVIYKLILKIIKYEKRDLELIYFVKGLVNYIENMALTESTLSIITFLNTLHALPPQ